MIYPFVRAKHDYGPRQGTLGLMLHMAEGFNTVAYLANDPRLGNSANYVCEATGHVVRMLPFDNTSGSLNPRDRTGDSPYYSHEHLVDVLGPHWTDPNPWVISMEIEGFRATGPNAKQAEAIVSWAADMCQRYPTLRGALGHHDQSPKGCPGTTAQMKAIFASIGGHGLWTPQEEPDLPGLVVIGVEPFAGTATVKGDGHSAIQMADRELIPLPNGATKTIAFKGRLASPFNAQHPDTTVYGCGDEAAVLLAGDVVVTAAAVDCSDQIAAQRERDRVASLAAIEEVFAA